MIQKHHLYEHSDLNYIRAGWVVDIGSYSFELMPTSFQFIVFQRFSPGKTECSCRRLAIAWASFFLECVLFVVLAQ